ncbi:MAG: hypothetical protein IBJ10_06035 [Phycisphaerales bacterium]|nr:hypothetical protein [Phycisphaerales bacterium]
MSEPSQPEFDAAAPTDAGAAPASDSAREDGIRRSRVIEVVYERLERIARARLQKDALGRIVRTRSLVHETALRLQAQRNLDDTDEDAVLAAAANLMSQTLVDLARKRQALKRSGEAGPPVTLNTAHLIDAGRGSIDAIEFADALAALARVSAMGAQTIQMRFWADMSFEQMARALGAPEHEVRNKFNFAKAWLSRRLTEPEGP